MSVDFVKTKHGFHNQLGNEQEQRNGVIVAQYLWYDQRSQCLWHCSVFKHQTVP